MLEELLPESLKNFVDTIFKPPIEFLQKVIEFLGELSIIAGKGININNYLGFVSYLPGSMQMVVNSLLSAVVFLAILRLIAAVMATYYNVKQGIKWW